MTPHDNARIRVYLTNAIEMLQKCLEPLDPYAELKAALKAGKTIQMSDADGNWKDFKRATPDWSAPLHAYRIKPWTLPDPPPGQAWHRTDWTQDMLPEGWRPMLLGEDGEGEYLSWDNKWRPLAHNDGPAKAESAHSRTRRPRPPVAPAEPRVVPPADKWAKEREHFSNGGKVQCRMRFSGAQPWGDWFSFAPGKEPRFCEDETHEYRIAPESVVPPAVVPLEACDVPPGSAVRYKNGAQWFLVANVSEYGVTITHGSEQMFRGTFLNWERLKAYYDIKRPGEDWQPASKPSGVPAERE